MKRLWEYLTKLSQESNEMPSMIAQLFSSKTIIPASDGILYPLSRSKMLLRDSETSNVCNCCSVMNKLGYPHVDFSKIDTQPSILLKQLTSCFQKGEEIVQCFSQAPPKSDKLYSIELTDDEVVSFRSSLGKCHRRREVSRYLLQMPLYYTIDGKKTRIHKATQVFLLDQNISLPEGIPSDHNGKIVLKATDSKFYSRVIPKNQLKYVSPEQLYIQFVFPLLSKLEEKDIKAHVDYILSREQQMKEAFNELKRTAFIAHDGKCYTPQELYNPEIEFYRTFYPEYILQDEWKDKTEALKRLNLHSTVTMDEWLKCANDFAEEADEPEVAKKEMIEKKSKVLLDEVSKIIKH